MAQLTTGRIDKLLVGYKVDLPNGDFAYVRMIDANEFLELAAVDEEKDPTLLLGTQLAIFMAEKDGTRMHPKPEPDDVEGSARYMETVEQLGRLSPALGNPIISHAIAINYLEEDHEGNSKGGH